MRENRTSRVSRGSGVLLAMVVYALAPGCSDGATGGNGGEPGDPTPVTCGEKTGRAPFDGKRRVLVGTERREYVLHVPASYDPSRGAPLVLMFHGLGGQAEAMPEFTGLDGLANEEGFLIAYAQGKRGPDGSTGWFASDGPRDFIFVEKILEELDREYCLDPRRTYAVGHSNGGFFTTRLACERTDLFAAFAAFAGGPSPLFCSPSRPPPIAFFQGDDDKVVDPSVTEQTKNDFVQMNRCTERTGLPDGCILYSACEGGSDVLWCLVPGMSHLAWPGGTNDLGGPIDGNAEMWSFFDAHPAPPASASR